MAKKKAFEFRVVFYIGADEAEYIGDAREQVYRDMEVSYKGRRIALCIDDLKVANATIADKWQED